MVRWRIAVAAAVSVAALAAVVVLAPGLKGQERRAPEARARSFHFADWFGAQIGVTVHDPDSGGGVVVDRVRDNSPAEKAGVKENDLIVEYDGERVRSARQFSRLVDETPQGRSVKMTLQRGGQKTTVDVTPEARQFGAVRPLERFTLPSVPEFPRDFDLRVLPEIYAERQRRLGVQLERVEDQLAEYFGVKAGVLVTAVAKDSPAARGGLKAGDVITKIAGEPVDDISDVRREIRRIDDDREFTVDVMRERKPLSLKIKLEPAGSSRRQGTPTEEFR